jgi:peptidoglycan L-alanyl-D-glutamate endopeptidase CwlK
MQLSARDLQRLEGVHPDLVRVVRRAAEVTDVPFLVVEGVRSRARQAELLRLRKTTTMNSRHLTGHAVDLVPLADTDGDGDIEISWRWHDFHRLSPVIKAVAVELGVSLEWGGDFRTFPDGPHWQLSWRAYPAPHESQQSSAPAGASQHA